MNYFQLALTILGYVEQYGPGLIDLFNKLKPILDAAAPEVKKLMDAGMSSSDAHSQVLNQVTVTFGRGDGGTSG